MVGSALVFFDLVTTNPVSLCNIKPGEVVDRYSAEREQSDSTSPPMWGYRQLASFRNRSLHSLLLIRFLQLYWFSRNLCPLICMRFCVCHNRLNTFYTIIILIAYILKQKTACFSVFGGVGTFIHGMISFPFYSIFLGQSELNAGN